MGTYSRTYNLTNGTVAYGDQVVTELDALGSSVNNIVNAQISSGAGITDIKLATISTANKVSISALGTISGLTEKTTLADADLFLINDSADSNAMKKVQKSSIVSPEQLIKGWIQFDGTGTPAIKDSYNVSGIVDNGTGDYTITWDTDFANANYVVVATAETYPNTLIKTGSKSAGSVSIQVMDTAGNLSDTPSLNIIAIGDR